MFEPYVPPTHGDLGYVSSYPAPKLLTLQTTRRRPRLWTTVLQCLKQNSIRQSLQCLNAPSLNRHSLVQGLREAILDGIHPKMIAKGSSGSYFARTKVDGKVQTVGHVPHLCAWGTPLTLAGLYRVFKPKDEEPYGRLNPKVLAPQLRILWYMAETLLKIDDQVATQTSTQTSVDVGMQTHHPP